MTSPGTLRPAIVIALALVLGSGGGVRADGPAPAPAAATDPAAPAATDASAPAASPSAAPAVPPALAPPAPARRFEVPGKIRVLSGDLEEDKTSDVLRFYNYVFVDAGDARIQADELIYRRSLGIIEAHGNVVLIVPGALLAGTVLNYSVENGTGSIDDVVAYLDQDNAILRARRIERLGPDLLGVEQGIFTTCTQPTPYWWFKLRHATFRLGQYAYLHGVSFRARGIPLFVSPYLIWPIKTGRATGFLFPDFRNSDKLGTSISLPFYWPFASNADVTLTATGYTKVGVGLQAALDWLPTWRSWAHGYVNWINDQVRRKNRYRFTWNHSQKFWNDFQLTANIEQVSDFDYFTDYETDLLRAAAPQTTSVVDLTRSWSWYSLSVRGRRYQQFYVTSLGTTSLLDGETVTTALPQIEFRGRSQRLGNSPVYLSFVSSVAGLERDILRPPADRPVGVPQESGLLHVSRDQWGRADLAPQLQMPVLQKPWGELTLTSGWRGTFYSARPDASAQQDEFGDPLPLVSRSVFRSLWNAGFTFTGPRFQRIFLTPKWSYSPKLKHVIEPFLTYSWAPESGTSSSEIPVYDEIDSIPGQQSDLSYGIRQRFLALRRSETGKATGIATAPAPFSELKMENKETQQSDEQAAHGTEVPPEQLDVDQSAGPVEFASLEISQTYSFVRTLSSVFSRDADTLGTTIAARHYGPVLFRARFNPTASEIVDFNYAYDPANHLRTQVSVSTTLTLSPAWHASGSWFRSDPSSGLGDPTSFVRASWGWVSPVKRFSLETSWDWNAEGHKLEHQQYQARWATQCCSFRLGYDQRSFEANYRREFSLVVDLFGIGEILKLHGSR